MTGVKKVVRVGDDAVAVIADTWWHAKVALDSLPIVWDEGENAKVSSASIARWLEEGLDDAQPAIVGNRLGDAKEAIASSAKTIEAAYSYPYQNHAAMEPLNATVLYTQNRCEAWCILLGAPGREVDAGRVNADAYFTSREPRAVFSLYSSKNS